MSNIDDLDRLVAVFIKQEDEHFSLFNYIQTVNQETDQHLEKTEELEVCSEEFCVRQSTKSLRHMPRRDLVTSRDSHLKKTATRCKQTPWGIQHC